MKYSIENYRNKKRFNEQYEEIYRFLLKAEKQDFNEHFHWGRFEWMHKHSMLEMDKLTSITMFRNGNGEIEGLMTYDTFYGDRTYLIHSISDKDLLNQMVDYVLENEDEKAVIKVNDKDTILGEVLLERGFEKTGKDNSVLELDLNKEFECLLPDDYVVSPEDFVADEWQYQLVIHKGFDNEDIPEKWDEEILALTPHERTKLKLFALKNGEYCAHCQLWYTEGASAYVEPVVTVPKHRGKGLAKSLIYEVSKRAKEMGAKRAIVLSDMDFYYKLGFETSSEVYSWEKSL